MAKNVAVDGELQEVSTQLEPMKVRRTSWNRVWVAVGVLCALCCFVFCVYTCTLVQCFIQHPVFV